ncbi:hypothetical protein [Kordia sp.]|uniref:hypothetical protein n=1 Tax=Kordia sp. TaxID=1965332 RepID=UPI0025BBA6C5|nr:hypothetical protein [Kordia sp.]MCH2195650.1 hypothetical protein [Kordia sp.]
MLVEDLNHLKLLSTNINGDFEDFYVLIANGLARIRKRILYDPIYDEFSLINEINESFQQFHSSKIDIESNLISAIKAKALFKLK